ncbi:hypothetical protein C8J57DRAFT_1201605, partial [Mycena rebaudengoi]
VHSRYSGQFTSPPHLLVHVLWSLAYSNYWASKFSSIPEPVTSTLILVSKFTQDKLCYSNRAWAKLSGLPAREIGRCECALGDALDCHL